MTQSPLHHDDPLIKLDDTTLQLTDVQQDIRNRTVIDRYGDAIGHVSALFLDPAERKIRMLQVGAGGFLGLGERHFLLPVDAVTRITKDQVQVDQTRGHVVDSPAYDPALTVPRRQEEWLPYYGHYGYAPYWGAGYVYPPQLYF